MKTLFLAIFIARASFGADFRELTVRRLNGSDIWYYLNTPTSVTGQIPILIVLQGSSCRSVYKDAFNAGSFVDQNKVSRLDVEKYGLDKNSSTCPSSYLLNNTIDQRISDYLQVISSIRKTSHSWWDGKVYILGGSEGGLLAPILANSIPETTKTVIMAGGTGWTMREEMLFLLEAKLKKQGLEEKIVKNEIKKMNLVFDDAILNPTSDKSYYGNSNTHKWWASILNLRPLNLMLKQDFPILMVHGDRDDSVPVESARATVSTFQSVGKSNLTYVEYKDLDHQWNDSSGDSHINDVMADVLKWLL